jgi:hypothetical protein
MAVADGVRCGWNAAAMNFRGCGGVLLATQGDTMQHIQEISEILYNKYQED